MTKYGTTSSFDHTYSARVIQLGSYSEISFPHWLGSLKAGWYNHGPVREQKQMLKRENCAGNGEHARMYSVITGKLRNLRR